MDFQNTLLAKGFVEFLSSGLFHVRYWFEHVEDDLGDTDLEHLEKVVEKAEDDFHSLAKDIRRRREIK